MLETIAAGQVVRNKSKYEIPNLNLERYTTRYNLVSAEDELRNLFDCISSTEKCWLVASVD